LREERLPNSRDAPSIRPPHRVLPTVSVVTLRGSPGRCLSPFGHRARVCFANHGARRAVRDLVTGATGFTGGHLARGLLARGHSVRVLVREPDQAGDLQAAGFDVAMGDIRDQSAVTSALRNVDVVYHIAAIYRQAGVAPATYRAVNATAVGEIIEAASRSRVKRVVHCSTVGVHGNIEHPPANEDAPLAPGDVYQVSKVEGERIARDAAARTGVEVVIARPSGIYGPGDRRLLKLFRGVARRR